MVKGATGQSEKAYFCKPLKYKLGKQWGIHKFFYMPNSPKALLGRDLLEQLGARITFEKREITLEAKDQQYIQVLSLFLTSPPTEGKFPRRSSTGYTLGYGPLMCLEERRMLHPLKLNSKKAGNR